VARKGRPIILSTGMSYLDEVLEALEVIREQGNPPVVLLHCVSNYPANPAEANLRAMRTMAEACRVPVGYSDHTMGIEVALAAVSLGACVIEKHLTLDRRWPGPDHQASIDPETFHQMVRSIRVIEQALGHGHKEPAASEAQTRAVIRRSLVAARDIPCGTMLTPELLAIKRPGTGLAPAMRARLVGQRTMVDIPVGTVVTWEMVGNVQPVVRQREGRSGWRIS
jgi:sialic acid synthase SpsE